MRRIVVLLGILLISVVLFGCVPKVGPVAPVEEKPAKAALPVAKEGWEAEWEKILKEARKEGRIVVYGPPFAETRRGFTEVFQKAYPGIELDYTGMRGAEAAPKIVAERRAGLYVADIHIGGTTTILMRIREYALPIKQFLLLPEVKDPKAWLEGKLQFSDMAEEINLQFAVRADSSIIYNTGLVAPGELTSFWDLVKPKWKERIIMQDPRTAGAGLAMATFWYTHKELGLDYIKAFAANMPALARDLRFQVESVGRGRYSIAVVPDTTTAGELQKAGMPIRWTEIMKEGTFSTSSFGSVIIMDKAPHPNAAILFLNWLLSKEGQTVWTTTSGLASRRLDTPTDHLIEAVRPRIDAFYWNEAREENIKIKEELSGHLNKIFAGF